MSWVRMDDRTPSHPKFEDLSDLAWALWTKALCWTYQPEHERTGGFVPRKVALSLLKSGPEAVEAAASELVEAVGDSCFGHASGLWVAEESGWRFHDWEKYRPSASKQCFEPGSEAAVEAGRLGGTRSAEKRREKFGSAQPKRTPNRASEESLEADSRSGSEALPEAPVPSPSRPDPDPLSLDPRSGSLDPKCRSGSQPVRLGKRGRARTVKHQIPDDWQPSAAHREEAARLGVSCDTEAQKFRDWCQANGRGFADFEAAFRNWLRRAKDFGAKPGPGAPARGESRADFQLRRQLERVKQLELEERDMRDLEAVL